MRVVATLAAIALLGCGGSSGQSRVYKGTSTTVITAGMRTDTYTSTNKVITVEQGDMPNEWLFVTTDTVYTATASGNSLSFASGQGFKDSQMPADSFYELTLSTGSGSLDAMTLTLSLSGSIMTRDSMGMTGSGSYQFMYNGTRQ
jgi:hypothetical protein